MPTVLVVDDHAATRARVRDALAHTDFDIEEADDGESAWRTLSTRLPDVVVTDLQMPRCDGFELIARIRSRCDVPVIALTAQTSPRAVVRALECGADDCLGASELRDGELVERILAASSCARQEDDVPALVSRRLVGESAATRRLRWQVAGLAQTDAPVLVSGAPGTGRATVARLLHDLGHASDERFVELGDDADEAVLRGALRGTVFLRDVASLSPRAQRTLASTLSRVGSTGSARRRLVAAARDAEEIREALAAGRLHTPLGKALLRFHLALPDLEARREDLPAIADAMVRRIGSELGRPGARLTAAAAAFLGRQIWPHGLTQLRSLLERAVATSPRPRLERATCADLLAPEPPSLTQMRTRSREGEYAALVEALEAAGGNVTKAAEALGCSRPTVYRRLRQWGLRRA